MQSAYSIFAGGRRVFSCFRAVVCLHRFTNQESRAQKARLTILDRGIQTDASPLV